MALGTPRKVLLATDLVILGSRGRGPIAGALLGSVAKRITVALPCDALVLRD